MDLQYRLDPEVIINGDEGRIEQIIQNIMDNSIRYTAEGRISIRLSQEKDKCVIQIEDTGIGISEEHLSKIKQRFYRVNKGRTRSDGGTGLGLAIAEKLVKLHQGELTVLSELNKGTTVRIVLPLFEIR
ncbi:sensor histidine kinase [Cytobacillus pseudoceanisediminis]|uniref:sensor histidine kinase n=1 Tax=Cytobacillus pseudoceanisediminis TaxID=3051614 RepID=UPI003F72C5B4